MDRENQDSIHYVRKTWEQAYTKRTSIMGSRPNDFFVSELLRLSPGKILLPGEGEGRHAIYAAGRGWRVDAFDISDKARAKAMDRARENNVSINYWLDEFASAIVGPLQYDVIAFIDVFPIPSLRQASFANLLNGLKAGGKVIFECFAVDNLSLEKAVGPQNQEQLYTVDTLAREMPGLIFGRLEQRMIVRHELTSYQAIVIQMSAVKALLREQAA